MREPVHIRERRAAQQEVTATEEGGHSGEVGTASESMLEFKADTTTIKRSVISAIAIQMLFKVKGVVTMPIVTHFLSPSDLGTLNLIGTASSLLVPLFCLNLIQGPAIYLVQESSKDTIRRMYNTVVNASALISLVASIALFAAVSVFGAQFLHYLPLVVLMVLSSLFQLLPSYVLSAFQKSVKFLKNTTSRDVIATILTIAFVIGGWSYYGIVAAIAIGNIFAGLLAFKLIRAELPWQATVDRAILKRFLRISIPLLPVVFFDWIAQSSSSYFLVYFSSVAAVGKLSVIVGLTNVILSVTYAMNLFWYPVSARLWIEDREGYRNAFRLTFVGVATVLLTLVLLFELNSEWIVRTFARNPELQEGYPIMGIIAFGFSMQVLINLLTAPLYSNKNVGQILLAYTGGAAVSIFLNILLIPRFGLLGTAIAMASSFSTIVIVMGIANYRVAHFQFLDRRLSTVFVAFIFLWALSASIRGSLGEMSCIGLSLASFAALTGLLIRFGLAKNEKTWLLRLIRRMLRPLSGGA